MSTAEMKATLCLLTLLGLTLVSVSAQNATTVAPTTTTDTGVTAPGYCSDDISEQCPEVDPSAPVILPNPENCAGFCECSNGLAISLTCPPGTLWDTTLGICATASDVDCGDRPIGGQKLFHH